MTMWTSLWLACSTPSGPFTGPPAEPSPSFADPGLGGSGASAVHQLWRHEGTYAIAPSTLPADFRVDGRIPVEVRPARGERRKHVWVGESAYTDLVRARVGPPQGLKLYADGKELPYSASGRREGTWRARGERVLVQWTEGPAPVVEMAWDKAQQQLFEREFARVGGLAEDFVRSEVTVDGETRPGLLLPAPSSATFRVALPEGARFEGWPLVAPGPLRTLRSDGAWVALTVRPETGGEVQVDRRFLRAGASFEPWRLDLEEWEGQTVDLVLSSEVYSTRDFDHVFVGAPAVWGRAMDAVRRVVMIGLDTTRPDHFGFFGYDRPTTPEMDAFLASATVFDASWTPAPRTRPSFRSATTGRNPLDAVGATNLGEVLQREGFATAGIVANIHLQPRFDFHHGFDRWLFDGGADAEDQVDRALSFLDDYPDRDAYLFLHFMDPHLQYRPKAEYARAFVQDPDPDLPESFGRWDVYKWMNRGEIDERRKQHIVDLYDAELRGMDEQLGRLFAQLDRMPGKTLVVLHNDHGEEFWEHGGFEHNHTLYDDVTRAVLAFREKGGQQQGRRVSVPTTLADIGPTLFDLARVANPPATDGRSLAALLLSSEPPAEDWAERPIGVGHLRYGTERWGVVFRNHKYVLHTATGLEELYDLERDPAEKQDLSDARDLTPWHEALSEAHAMPVGPGWRIEVDIVSEQRAPIRISLPGKATAHGVIDPEAAVENPVNQAWGQEPPKSAADVGQTALADEGTTLIFTPAPRTGRSVARGTLYVMLEPTPTPRPVSIERSDETFAAVPSKDEAASAWRLGLDRLEVREGTVLVPPPSEAARIRALKGQTDDAGADREALQLLGYIEEDDEEEGEAGVPPHHH